jgi:golgin subfamily B member 1
VLATRESKEEPPAANAPPAHVGYSKEEHKLAILKAKKIRRGKLALEKEKERYTILKERLAQRAAEQAAIDAAVAVKKPSTEHVKAEEVQPAAGVSNMAGQEVEPISNRTTLEAEMEIELAALEAKKVRKGKLKLSDKRRLKFLKNWAAQRNLDKVTANTANAPAPRGEPRSFTC